MYRNDRTWDDNVVGCEEAAFELRAMGLWRAIAVFLSLLAGGCFPREPEQIGAVDPSSNIPAIQRAVREKDYKAIPALVGQLDSDDPAVRFYAIEALEKLTGQTLGYQYYDEPDQRKAAIRRWREWLTHNQHAGARAP